MTAKRFYGIVLLVVILGMWAIVAFPAEALTALSIGIPFAIIGAAISTGYLARIYRRQPIPRSRFFRMLVESFFALLLIGVWVGYLSLARVLERASAAGQDVPFLIPAPPPNVSSPISALVVIIVFAAPIRFAVEVYRRRSLSSQTVQATEVDDIALDREPDKIA